MHESLAGDRGRFWREVRVLLAREGRAALRERLIVVHSLLIPVVLYPFILWVMFTGMLFVQGQSAALVSRITVQGWPAAHGTLRRDIETDRSIKLVDASSRPADAAAMIRNGEIDAALAFIPAPAEAATLPGNFTVHLTFNESRERSIAARNRLTSIIEKYRDRWLRREAEARRITPAEWQGATLAMRNVASGREMGAFILGLVLPLLFVIMVAVGSFYPAVDTTAGERERNTWETLMSTAASRSAVVTAKYLYVAGFGCLAGLLNLAAMTVTMKPIFERLLGGAGSELEFRVPFGAYPLLAATAILLAGFVAAVMMLLASFARTFREGQAMIMPFYMLLVLPPLFLQIPGLRFSFSLAFVPVVNLTMVVREALSGVFHGPQIAVTMSVSAILIVACLSLARLVLSAEDYMIGSYNGSLPTFVRERLLARSRADRGARGAHR